MAHYVNNKDLYEEMKKYKQKCIEAEAAGKPLPVLSNYIGQCFLMICNKLATKPNFGGYTYKDEMIADGIENCISAAHSFDPEKSNNPFAYFTQIAWNAFIRRISKEKKQTYIKHKNFENKFTQDQIDSVFHDSHVISNDYSTDVIKNFEEKLTKPIKKSKIGIEKFIEGDKNEEPASNTN
jgi:hypothetical protein